jgi:hypothetical protein
MPEIKTAFLFTMNLEVEVSDLGDNAALDVISAPVIAANRAPC